MSDRQPRRRGSTRLTALVGLALVGCLVLPVGCAKVDEGADGPSRERQVTFVADRLIPAGKTVRAAVADGSITESAVPGDILTGDDLDNPGAIECLVAVRAVPAGTLLRRSMFVEPDVLGLDAGLTDGTTVDPEC